MCTVAPTDLVQLLARIRDRHPDILLDLRDRRHAVTLDNQLRDGELEIAIIGRPETEAPAPELHYLPLYREQFMIVTSADHSDLRS